MATRITGTARHDRYTHIGDLVDNASHWLVTAGTVLALLALGVLLGVMALAATLHGLGVLK